MLFFDVRSILGGAIVNVGRKDSLSIIWGFAEVRRRSSGGAGLSGRGDLRDSGCYTTYIRLQDHLDIHFIIILHSSVSYSSS